MSGELQVLAKEREEKLIKGRLTICNTEKNGRVVDFKFCSLTQIPQLTYSLRTLQTLILANNSIVHLQRDIWDYLQDLEHLDLSFNKVEELPDEVFGLARLLSLNMSNNPLKSISSSMGRAITLTELNFERCTELPPDALPETHTSKKGNPQ